MTRKKKNHRGQEITLKRSEAREWKWIPRLANVNDKTIINHTYDRAKPMWTSWIIFKFENMQQNTGRTPFGMIVFYNIVEEKKYDIGRGANLSTVMHRVDKSVQIS